jgi:hypothetical protein
VDSGAHRELRLVEDIGERIRWRLVTELTGGVRQGCRQEGEGGEGPHSQSTRGWQSWGTLTNATGREIVFIGCQLAFGILDTTCVQPATTLTATDGSHHRKPARRGSYKAQYYIHSHNLTH